MGLKLYSDVLSISCLWELKFYDKGSTTRNGISIGLHLKIKLFLHDAIKNSFDLKLVEHAEF